MTERRFLAGCLALAAALSFPAANGQAASSPARSPAPAPATAPAIVTPTPSLTPTLPAPVLAPPPAAPAPVIAREVARSDTKTYDFESDTVEGDLSRPEAAAVAAAPPDVPAYSDLCKASPKPPWCSDAPPRGNGN